MNRLILRRAVTCCAIALFAALSATSRYAFAQTCSSITDEQIVTDINTQIASNKGLVQQMKHINVFAINAVAKLQGWADNQSDYDKVVDIVSNTRCVRLVNVNLFEEKPPPPDSPLRLQAGGCVSGTKPCGDVCIPVADACNIGPKTAQ